MRKLLCRFFFGINSTVSLILTHNSLLRPPCSPLQLNWSNSVVIFDEAHNLESVASEAASFELTSAQVAGAQEEALRCHKILTEGGGGVDEVCPASP